MKIIIATIAILYSSLTFAAEKDLWLDVNVGSYHSTSEYCEKDKCKKYNQFNYGLGLSYEISKSLELTGGYFRNSFDKNSFYAGTKIKHDFVVNGFTISPGVVISITTGYNNTTVNASRMQLFGMPTISVSYSRFRGVFGILPLRLIGASDTDIIAFQAGIKF